MIDALIWLAMIVHRPAVASSPPPTPQLLPAAILQRYSAALHALKEPHIISFDYTLEQAGVRTLSQTHRVFRLGNDERDETLTVDGKRLSPPKVRIFRGRRNRYTIAALAPRLGDYDFSYIGSRRDGRHLDYVFRLAPKSVSSFRVTEVTIDGVRFLPVAMSFATAANDGAGSVTFGSNARWWVPYAVTASATVAPNAASEKLNFYTYRFPQSLPSSTFAQARRLAPRGEFVPLQPALAPVAIPVAPTRMETNGTPPSPTRKGPRVLLPLGTTSAPLAPTHKFLGAPLQKGSTHVSPTPVAHSPLAHRPTSLPHAPTSRPNTPTSLPRTPTSLPRTPAPLLPKLTPTPLPIAPTRTPLPLIPTHAPIVTPLRPTPVPVAEPEL